MSYTNDAEHSPNNSPELYRRASLSDIGDPKILGFYLQGGRYLRKNGAPLGSVKFPVVAVLDPYSAVTHINRGNFPTCYVRLDETLIEENAPPKHFKLTRITVDVMNWEVGDKFIYLLGARGDVQEAHASEAGDFELTLWFLEPILVPPTLLLNLLDDCVTAQPEWGEKE